MRLLSLAIATSQREAQDITGSLKRLRGDVRCFFAGWMFRANGEGACKYFYLRGEEAGVDPHVDPGVASYNLQG